MVICAGNVVLFEIKNEGKTNMETISTCETKSLFIILKVTLYHISEHHTDYLSMPSLNDLCSLPLPEVICHEHLRP